MSVSCETPPVDRTEALGEAPMARWAGLAGLARWAGMARLAGLARVGVVALVALSPVGAVAAPPSVLPKNTVTIEPIALIFTRTISIEYERALSDLVSVYIAPAMTLGSVEVTDSSTSYWALGAGVGARFFFWSPAPEGFFFQPFIQLAYSSAESSVDQGTGLGWGTGALVGYTFILGHVFDVSLGIGGGYFDIGVTLEGANDESNKGFAPLGRLAVGVAF